jgi:hypothetical protein
MTVEIPAAENAPIGMTPEADSCGEGAKPLVFVWLALEEEAGVIAEASDGKFALTGNADTGESSGPAAGPAEVGGGTWDGIVSVGARLTSSVLNREFLRLILRQLLMTILR